MEKEEEVIENITLKDPYDLNIDPFDLSDLQKESDVVDEVVREEEFTVDDVNEEPVEDSSQIPTNEVIEQEEQQNSTEESFDIEVGKGMLRS